jgi:hypothetical protein
LIDKETAALFPQSGCHRSALHVAFFLVTLDHDARNHAPAGFRLVMEGFGRRSRRSAGRQPTKELRLIGLAHGILDADNRTRPRRHRTQGTPVATRSLQDLGDFEQHVVVSRAIVERRPGKKSQPLQLASRRVERRDEISGLPSSAAGIATGPEWCHI